MSEPAKPKSSLSTMIVPFLVFAISLQLLNIFNPPKEPAKKPPVEEKTTNKTSQNNENESTDNKAGTSTKGDNNTVVEKLNEKPVKNVENKASTYKLDAAHSHYVFSSLGATVSSVTLDKNDEAGIHGKGIDLLTEVKGGLGHFAIELEGLDGLATKHWKQISADSNKVVYELQVNGVTVTKTFVLVSDYVLTVSVSIDGGELNKKLFTMYGARNITIESTSLYDASLCGGTFIGTSQNGSRLVQEALFSDLQDAEEEANGDVNRARVYNNNKDDALGNASMNWVGLKNKYFTVLAKPSDEYEGFVRFAKGPKDKSNNDAQPANGLMGITTRLPDSNSYQVELPFYIGPRQEATVEATKLGSGLELILEQDRFLSSTTIEGILLSILKIIYRLVGSYGWAIILLTIMVRASIHPLTRFSQTRMQESSEKMAILQPKIEELKKKYAKDPKELQRQQMKLFAENNAMGGMMLGCLPILLQFPIYIGLYTMLGSYIEFRGNGFWLIEDLSLPDELIDLGDMSLPFFGSAINVLPFMTLAVTIISMRRGMKRNNANKKMTPEQQMQQKMMYFIMPPFLMFITYGFSSGLLLYWFTSGLIGTLEAEYIRKQREKKKQLDSAPQLKPAGR